MSNLFIIYFFFFMKNTSQMIAKSKRSRASLTSASSWSMVCVCVFFVIMNTNPNTHIQYTLFLSLISTSSGSRKLVSSSQKKRTTENMFGILKISYCSLSGLSVLSAPVHRYHSWPAPGKLVPWPTQNIESVPY